MPPSVAVTKLEHISRSDGAEVVNDYRFIKTGADRFILVFGWHDDGSPETFLSMPNDMWRAALRRMNDVLSDPTPGDEPTRTGAA